MYSFRNVSESAARNVQRRFGKVEHREIFITRREKIVDEYRSSGSYVNDRGRAGGRDLGYEFERPPRFRLKPAYVVDVRCSVEGLPMSL